MKNTMIRRASRAAIVTGVLGSTFCATAYAGTTSHQETANNGAIAKHTRYGFSYDNRVLALIGQLQKQLNALQTGAATTSTTGNSTQTPHTDIMIGPWFPGNLFSALATDLGISQSTLEADLQAGQTIAQIAAKQGVSTTTLISELESTETSQLQAQISQLESAADNWITSFVNGTQPSVNHPIPLINPGGPMIPATGSQTNPGGPMIPANGSQTNPGGPMIPAIGPQTNPGGPMIPAPAANSTDATAYKQLASAARSLIVVLHTDAKNGNTSAVNTYISQANSILNTLKAAFPSSSDNTAQASFTADQLSAMQTATQALENIVTASGVSTTTSNANS